MYLLGTFTISWNFFVNENNDVNKSCNETYFSLRTLACRRRTQGTVYCITQSILFSIAKSMCTFELFGSLVFFIDLHFLSLYVWYNFIFLYTCLLFLTVVFTLENYLCQISCITCINKLSVTVIIVK